LPDVANRRLALLDWDNTLRPGFTVTDWTNFLKSRNQYDRVINDQIFTAIENYHRHKLTYAELSELIAELYASGLEGQTVSSIQNSAIDFVRHDQANLFRFTPHFLMLLADEEIGAYIVSGCPAEVLSAYSSVLTWHEHYGIEAECQNGYYTGKVAADRANMKGKQLAVAQIIGDDQALLAAGDSVSDLPLFENAKIRLIIDNPQLLESQPDAHHLDPLRPISETLDAVRGILWTEFTK
jgi:phosphoserine phosphatase